ncbi:serpin B4-like [Nasonia vitripennis]|uniref:Serpin domain-containing protein n=1 Tax=Nasonia vitripennis TaxID=7425 RepID=A0A7M7QL50_NASVI|nr:serpin B4-like [Nasonia vitripennis]
MESDPEVDAICKSCEKFAADLYKNTIKEGNTIISPLASYLLLSMTVNGADDDTESQIRKALHLPKDEPQSSQGFRSLIDSLNSVADFELSVLSKIVISKTFNINPEFQSILENSFRNKPELLDFSNKSEVVETVNTWCEENTKNNIRQIVSYNDINKLSTMLLLNAVYFNGKWQFKFSPKNTYLNDFYVSENDKTRISMMTQRRDLVYGELDFIDAKFAELPYRSSTGNLKMVVIVPNKIDGLAEIENNLERVNYESLSEFAKEDVEIKLPVIDFESTIDFKACLKQMGIVDMFEEQRAQFRKLQSGELWPIWVDKIMQKTFIKVNEDGTEAAAITFGAFLKKCRYRRPPPPPKKLLYADRPFLSIIMYEKVPLFYCRFTG